jgi:hypothetical protein
MNQKYGGLDYLNKHRHLCETETWCIGLRIPGNDRNYSHPIFHLFFFFSSGEAGGEGWRADLLAFYA